MWLLLVISLYAVWSSVFSLGKLALQYSPPLFLTGFRMVLAGIILLSFVFFTKRSSFKLERKQWISLLALAFFSVYLTNILEFWSLKHLSAAKTCFIYSLTPFFAALFSYLHFKEKMNARKWLGMAICFIGVAPVLITQTGSEELLKAFSFFSWPTLAMMLAVLSSVYGWVLLRVIVKDQEVSPIMANGSSMFIGGLFAFIHSLFIDSWHPLPVMDGHFSSFLKGVLLITLISNIICYNLYGVLLKRFTATFLSFAGLLSPVFASLNAWFFLGEPPSWTIFFCTGIVSCGLWIVYSAELKQGYIKSNKTIPIIQK